VIIEASFLRTSSGPWSSTFGFEVLYLFQFHKQVVSEFGTRRAVDRERIGTHNEILEALNSMCKSAGRFAVTEAKNTFLLTDPDNRTRPDIVGGLDVKIT
jgi:hypothetical protein